MRNGLVALILYCLIVAASWAEESAPLRLPSAKVALEPDDTLEFSLTAKGNPQHPPQVGAWLLPSGTENPAANANPVARTFVSPSAKPGEWLVHVRGLKAERGTWDLFVRWSPAPTDPDAANGSRGEMRLNGAVSIKAEAADVVLLMDGSLSMGRTDPQRLRVGAAREFIEQSRRSGSVGRIAIVQFDSKSRTVATLTNVNENFEGFLEAIDERGETDIDGGIRHSLPLLSEAGAIVLLTDGKQEPGEYRNAHAEAKKAGIAIHTLALGRDADRTLLKRIAAETGGTYSDAVKDRDLALAYAAIASRIARVRPILTLESAQQPAAIPVDGACRSLAISMNGEQSGTLSVVGPRNENWTSPAQVAPSYFKDAPATGGWTATWNGPANPLAAAARTGLYPQFFRADFSGDGAVVIDTDEPALALSFADSGATLPAQRVETTLIFSDNTRQIIQLRDDGKNGDLRANDGVFAADLPPFPAGNGSYPESARGTVRVVVEGLRDGLPYRRESQSAFVFRRHLGAALIAGGSLDFGMRFNGDTARLEIPLRVRGPGGILTARMLPTENAELRNGTHNVELTSVPAQLASRQRSSAELALTIGQWQEPGLYGGIVEFELAGTGRARVPWTVRVQSPQLRVADRINVGLVTPGQSFELPLELSVDGGIARVESVELALPWRSRKLISLGVRSTNVVPGIDLSLRTPDKFPWRITATPSKQSLDFTVAEDAPGGALDARLILRDAARRELAVIALSGRIASHYMQAQLPLLLGPVEAGDRIGRTLRWTLAGPGALDARLPERSKLTLLPDPQFPALVPELNPAAPGDERGAKSRIRVATPAEAHAGEAGGWLQIECGPALIQRRWSAFVVQPHLGVEPSELDFGTMAPGQKRVLSTALTTHAVKPVPVAARVVRPIAKPNLPEIKIDDSSLGFALPPDERTTGTPLAMNVSLDLPDSTQDGTYTGSVEIASRLGHIALPVRVNVVSPVPVAPFHVSPAHILLRFPMPDAPPPTERLRIVSHRDTDQALVLRMQAEGEKTCANLLLDPESGLTTETMTLTLPARATLGVSVRAQPDARAGERSRVSIAGDGDEHIVSLLIERPQSHAVVVTEEPSRLLNWLLLLLVLLLMLIAYLIRNLIKRPWLRYATYSILFHLAFLPLVMPKEKILEALPSSMQITLLETEASLGMELSEQQMRRLDALQAGAEPPPAVREQTLLADAPLPSQTVPEKKAADAPSKAELEKRAAEDLRAALEALPEPVRKVAHDAADRPLDAEALRPPDAAPKLQQPAENAVAARTASTLAERFNDAPLPAAPQRPDLQPERSAADLPLATLSESTPTRPAPNSPSPQRPQERTPTLDEAPLQIETLPNEVSIKPATKIAEATDRVRDVAAQVQSESGGSAGAALPSPTLPAANSGSSGADSSARSTQLPASKTGERVAAPVSGAGNSSAATTGRPAVTSGLGALDGGDAPLDSGPRAGSVAKPGSETGTGDRGGGEGPRTAHGMNLTGDSSDRGSIQHLAAALERSAAVAGGKAAPRTGEGTFERRSSPGDERTSGVGNATADAGMRPARDLGTGLDGSPLSPGDLGKIAQAKPGGDPRGAPSTEPGRGAAVAIPGNLSSKGSLAGLPAAFGPPQLGTTARPGERNTPVLKPTPGFANLDPRPAGGPGGGKVAASQKGERVMNAPYTGALLKVGIGLSRHNGDWNSSPTALYNLRTAFLERCGLPEVEFKVNTIELSDLKGLLQNRTVLITSNNPIAFKPEELRAMREYMLAGGTLWVNDSSASESNTFDAAFRASIAGLLPGAELAPLPLEHPFFAACYDLRNGFKGYRVPPGDKYRVNYIEALVTADGRAPLIYTRNDYADGLEIDPRMSAGGKSLTDLTNAEMQEASLRFCLNLVSYSMQGSAPRMPPPPEGVAEFEKVYRYNGPELPKLDDFSVLQDQWQKPTWLAEKDWCNPTEMKIVEDAELKGKVVRVDFKGGAKFKAAVTRNLPVDFATTRALVADIHSSLGSGFNVALLFYTKDGRSYETRPVFVRPGLNRNVRFPLDMGDMKSSATNPPWKEYDQPFAPRNNVERVTLLFYNLGENGAVKIGAIREQK